MRQTTAINQAYQRYARAYEIWHASCEHIPIKVLAPRILYLPGRGYEINGEVRRETAQQLISTLNSMTRDCLRLIDEACKPTAPSFYAALEVPDPALLDGTFESEVARESQVAI